MNLLIAGDIVTNSSNEKLFENKELDKVLGIDLLNLWNSSDYKVFNLEAPITDYNIPINKCRT